VCPDAGRREGRSTVGLQSNWWEGFFEGVVVDLWLRALPAEHTQSEADRLDRMLGVPAGAEILDVPCGGGRLSLPLAERGYRVTAVDSSPEFLRHARASDGSGQVSWEERDMRDLPWLARFDGAFCVGNSFGYLDDIGNAAFLRAVRAALKPGARFVLETPMVLENLLGHLQHRSWWKAGDIYLLVENRYDQAAGRLDIEYTFISNGRAEVRRGTHRAYAYRELVDLLSASGFAVEVSEPWTREADTVTLIATAIGSP
jgi:2-polyprenyl-3-methyl-5-hydroxy-6-metoxy-1,4-benzoquinol methylase